MDDNIYHILFYIILNRIHNINYNCYIVNKKYNLTLNEKNE